jgi:hypothetical protein
MALELPAERLVSLCRGMPVTASRYERKRFISEYLLRSLPRGSDEIGWYHESLVPLGIRDFFIATIPSTGGL